MSDLPNVLSDLLEVAARDLEAVATSDKYRINALTWHKYQPDRPCAVCLAGAVMAGAMGAQDDLNLTPYMFDGDVQDKLLALDDARTGRWRSAAFKVYGEDKFNYTDGHWEALEKLMCTEMRPPRLEDVKAFLEYIRKAVVILREAGL